MINWLIGNGADILMDFESWIYLTDEEVDKVFPDRKNVCVQHMGCLASMVLQGRWDWKVGKNYWKRPHEVPCGDMSLILN